MKVLFIGDIVGKPGRQAVAALLPCIKEEAHTEVTIANAENAAGGSGLTPKIVRELLGYGIDVLTSGDHIWKRREVLEIMGAEKRLLRAANYPEGAPGQGAFILKDKHLPSPLGVLNLLGRVFMPAVECPFKTAARLIEGIKKETPIIVVDIHAEATSEKVALGWFLDGEVSAVVGTHTHVQTADERILPKGTAYLTDLGMTGPHDSVIGQRVEQILERFLTGMPTRFQVACQNIKLCGAILDIDPKTGKANSIQRIQRNLPPES